MHAYNKVNVIQTWKGIINKLWNYDLVISYIWKRNIFHSISGFHAFTQGVERSAKRETLHWVQDIDAYRWTTAIAACKGVRPV